MTTRDDSTQALSAATLRAFFLRERRGAQERLSVRKIKDLLRLHQVGGVSSRRQLARAVGCGKTAVTDCLRRGGSGWPECLGDDRRAGRDRA